MKKVKVNQDVCIGCGACVAIDSEHFEFNDEGFSTVISEENLDSEELMNAINSCPTSAISSEEADSEECSKGACNNENCECENCECDSEDAE